MLITFYTNISEMNNDIISTFHFQKLFKTLDTLLARI